MSISSTIPFWRNGCNHEGYLFSYTCVDSIDGKVVEEKVHAYVFDHSPQSKRQGFCLRIGNEPHEYCSPGDIRYIIGGARYDTKYRELLALLAAIGYFRWEPCEENNVH